MNDKKYFISKPRALSFCGIAVALCVILNFLSTMGIARIANTFLASILTLPLLYERKYGYSMLVYLSTIMLGFFMNLHSGTFLYALCAYYPTLMLLTREKLNKFAAIIQIIALTISLALEFFVMSYTLTGNLFVYSTQKYLLFLLAGITICIVARFFINFLIDLLGDYIKNLLDRLRKN